MNAKYNHRFLKIFFSVYMICLAYAIFHNFVTQVNFQRFPNIFTAFIEMCLNNHVDLRYVSLTPLFHPYIQVDSSLSTIAQGIMETESYFPNMVMLHLTLAHITGLPPQVLMTFPFGAIFLAVIYLAMVKVYIQKTDASYSTFYIFYTLLGIYGILYLMTTKGYAAFYAAAMCFPLIFTAFICIKKFYDGGSHRFHYYLLICLLMFSLANYWHSALMIVLFFTTSLWVVSGIFYLSAAITTKPANIKWNENNKNIFIRSTSLFIISIVLSLTCMHLWQSSYLEGFYETASLIDFLQKLLIKLFGGAPFPVPYAFSYKDLFFGKIYFISILSIYILSTLILIVPLLLHILQSMREKTKVAMLPLIFGLAIILAQIIMVMAYYKSNSINFFYVPLFFPIFGVYVFNTVSKKIKKFMILSLILMCMLSLTCNVSLHLTNEAGETSVTKYDDTKSSFEWLYHNMDGEKMVITDFNILGKYLQRETKISKPSIEYGYISTDSYSVLVGDNEVIPNYLTKNYAVVDHATMSKGLPIHSNTARALLKPELEQINNCSNQDKIYEDSYISTFMFR